MTNIENFDEANDDDENNNDKLNDTPIIRIGPGQPRVSFILACPICNEKSHTPELVSPAINDNGEQCPYDTPGSRWMEWHECVSCGEWYSILNSNDEVKL